MKSGKVIQTEGIDLLAKEKIYRSLDEDSEGYKYLGISRWYKTFRDAVKGITEEEYYCGVKTKRRECNCSQLKGGLDCEMRYRNQDWTKNELEEMDRIKKTPKLLTIYRSTLGRS